MTPAGGAGARNLAMLRAALLTGVFCAVFTILVSFVTDMLALYKVVGISFLSGSLGSVFSQAVLRRSGHEAGR